MKNKVHIHVIPARFRVLTEAGLLLGIMLFASMPAFAQDASTAPPPDDDQPSFMKLLTANGLHDMENESWNVYGQFTYISSWKPSFAAAYTNLNGSTNSLFDR